MYTCMYKDTIADSPTMLYSAGCTLYWWYHTHGGHEIEAKQLLEVIISSPSKKEKGGRKNDRMKTDNSPKQRDTKSGTDGSADPARIEIGRSFFVRRSEPVRRAFSPSLFPPCEFSRQVWSGRSPTVTRTPPHRGIVLARVTPTLYCTAPSFRRSSAGNRAVL